MEFRGGAARAAPGTIVAHKTGEITPIHHDAAIMYGGKTYVLVLLVYGMENSASKSP